MIHIYTDGGCSGNPGPGGWAYVMVAYGEEEDGVPAVLAENWGAENSTTNNRMELRAVIAALKAYMAMREKDEKVTLYTDSQYVQKGITEWIHSWKKNSWRTSQKKPVKNQDLWQELDELNRELSIAWAWVKGHAGDQYNEHCDQLTQKAINAIDSP